MATTITSTSVSNTYQPFLYICTNTSTRPVTLTNTILADIIFFTLKASDATNIGHTKTAQIIVNGTGIKVNTTYYLYIAVTDSTTNVTTYTSVGKGTTKSSTTITIPIGTTIPSGISATPVQVNLLISTTNITPSTTLLPVGSSNLFPINVAL